jgi:long-subunit acyl-CoA synthetase (AMP-forming)
VRGRNVMKGHRNHAEATADAIVAGWLYNGDTGFVDEDGYLEIADRTAMSSPGTR